MLPVRGALNPILADDTVIDLEEASLRVFYTPLAQRISHQIGLIIAGGAGAFLLAAWFLQIGGGPAPLQGLCTLLAFAIAGIPAIESVWEKLRELRVDIDLLMLLGAGLAAVIGSPFEGALLLFLFALSGGLEGFAVRRTQKAITGLRQLTPAVATRIEGNETRRVPLRQLHIGDLVLVRPGDKVAVDGTIVTGSSSVDEAAITGESVPRDCGVGDAVFAGTQNINGRLEVRVNKLASDTTLAKIVELVTAARHSPTKAQRLIDRIGPTYSVCVIAAAVLVGFGANLLFGIAGSEATRRGIAVLIVASPCALIIATPVAYLAAIAAAARSGVLVKGGSYLEAIAHARTFVFDKTGTLTTGKMRLTDVDTRNGVTEEEALRLAGAVEGASNHPLAVAVSRAVKQRGLSIPTVQRYEAVPGIGVSGEVEGRQVWIGRPEAAAAKFPSGDLNGLSERSEAMRRGGKTVAAMVIDHDLALLGFQDTIREAAAECVGALRAQGVGQVQMLTGDSRVVAESVSSRIGLDGFMSDLLPEQKVKAVASLREGHGAVVLVGDGINDAPALAHADVGIAMGGTGADVALEASDVVIMKDRLEALSWLHRHAQRTARIVRQNLTFAISVIGVLSVFASLGEIPLPLAVIGHEGSTVLVALNALRLLRA